MNKFKQYYKTLLVASTPLPQVMRKPALLKIWFLKASKHTLYLLASLFLLFIVASPVSQSIVDYWYPLNQNSFKNSISDLFNSPALRKKEKLRESRYQQLLFIFWGLGFISTAIVLVLELPRAIRKGKQRAQVLLEQSENIRSKDPVLAETLATTAQNLLLESEQPDHATRWTQDRDSSSISADILKTKALNQAKKTVRFVGDNQRYRIEKALASGGSGIVYLAMDTVLGRQVALKELLDDQTTDQQQAERFKVEARALALLNHPHILPVYDLLEENGQFWLVMELLTGGDLSDKINQAGALDVDESVDIVKGVASGLGYAHQQGFIHRDIKPANILFSADGSYRITDFGIAKHETSTVKTQHGLVLGSPGYMSPEQAAGEDIDLRSDIYSLGITLYQMVTAQIPFQGDTRSVMAQHISKPPGPPSLIKSTVNSEVEAVILKMIEKKPDDRYQSTEELIHALNGINQA